MVIRIMMVLRIIMVIRIKCDSGDKDKDNLVTRIMTVMLMRIVYSGDSILVMVDKDKMTETVFLMTAMMTTILMPLLDNSFDKSPFAEPSVKAGAVVHSSPILLLIAMSSTLLLLVKGM